MLCLETLDAVLLGHGELDEVPEGPCYDVAVSLDITLFAVFGAYDSGDFARYRRLFCDDYLHDSDFLVVLQTFSDMEVQGDSTDIDEYQYPYNHIDRIHTDYCF